MVNYNWFAWKLACMWRTYRKCNPMVGLSKYEFNNKLLGDATFFRITLGVTYTQPRFLNSLRILTNLPLDYIIFIYFSCLQNFMWSKINSHVINQLSKFKFSWYKITHKRWDLRSNSKLHPICMKIGMHVTSGVTWT